MKWEYNSVVIKGFTDLKILNGASQEGWELVNVIDRNIFTEYIFKRPVEIIEEKKEECNHKWSRESNGLWRCFKCDKEELPF